MTKQRTLCCFVSLLRQDAVPARRYPSGVSIITSLASSHLSHLFSSFHVLLLYRSMLRWLVVSGIIEANGRSLK